MRNEFAAQRGRLALFLPVFFGAGSVAYFSGPREPGLALPLALAAGAAVLAWVLRSRLVARLPAVALAVAAAGFADARLHTWLAPPWLALPRHAVVVTGRVAAVDVLARGRRMMLTGVSLDGAPPGARAVRIRLRDGDAQALGPGDVVRVRALLQPPAAPDYPGGRDVQRDAFFAGIGGYGFALGPVARVSGAGVDPLAALREVVAARIMAVLPGERGAVAATLLTGLSTAIPEGDRAAFEASGLAHLLAVAGLHMGIVMGLVFAGVRLALAVWEHAALVWPTRKIAFLAALGAGFFYMVETGAHVPTVRSFAMAALVVAGELTARPAISLRALALAAMVVMVASPVSVLGVSFQMSFAAVLCLIAAYQAARPVLDRLEAGGWRGVARQGALLGFTSLIAGTASLPFAAYHFGQAALFFVPANVVAVPITAFLVMPLGLAALALMPFGAEAVALVPAGWGIWAVTAVAHFFAGLPGAEVAVGQVPAASLCLVALGLSVGGILRGWPRVAGVPLLVGGVAAWVLAPVPDVFVGAAGRPIVVRGEGRVVTLAAAARAGPEAAVRLWGALDDGGEICAGSACGAGVTMGKVGFWAEGVGGNCGVSVIVSPVWLHDPCPGVLVVDRAFVRREGAVTVRLTGEGDAVVTDRGVRGERPWVIRERVGLPMARTE